MWSPTVYLGRVGEADQVSQEHPSEPAFEEGPLRHGCDVFRKPARHEPVMSLHMRSSFTYRVVM